jgi:hypothetical protein
MEKILHGLEHLPEKFHGLRVLSTTAPQMLCETHLGQRVITQSYLPDGYVAGRELPYSEKTGDRELGNARDSKYELAKAKQNANTKLCDGDQAYAELTDRDHTLGHANSILRVAAESDMNQRIAIECLS